MSDGIKIPVVVPWSLVAAAAIALIFMYRDVQTMKESMVKSERIAALETDVANLKRVDEKTDESIRALWRARSRRDGDDQ